MRASDPCVIAGLYDIAGHHWLFVLIATGFRPRTAAFRAADQQIVSLWQPLQLIKLSGDKSRRLLLLAAPRLAQIEHANRIGNGIAEKKGPSVGGERQAFGITAPYFCPGNFVESV